MHGQHDDLLTARVTDRAPSRRPVRRIPKALVALPFLVIVAMIGAVGYQSLARSNSPATGPIFTEPLAHRPPERPPSRVPRGALGEAGGAVPDGVTVFDDEYPAVANLDPALLRALRRAATDAAGNGVEFYVDSGWRSPQYQQQLLDEAISKYGSEEKAAQWVATPDTSAHVSGDAVDIGHAGAKWLSEHGDEYGLCQIYENESWHYELRPEAIDRGCPAMYADPTHDPRMQR
jgi:hypothetical protein